MYKPSFLCGLWPRKLNFGSPQDEGFAPWTTGIIPKSSRVPIPGRKCGSSALGCGNKVGCSDFFPALLERWQLFYTNLSGTEASAVMCFQQYIPERKNSSHVKDTQVLEGFSRKFSCLRSQNIEATLSSLKITWTLPWSRLRTHLTAGYDTSIG